MRNQSSVADPATSRNSIGDALNICPMAFGLVGASRLGGTVRPVIMRHRSSRGDACVARGIGAISIVGEARVLRPALAVDIERSATRAGCSTQVLRMIA